MARTKKYRRVAVVRLECFGLSNPFSFFSETYSGYGINIFSSSGFYGRAHYCVIVHLSCTNGFSANRNMKGVPFIALKPSFA